MDSSTKNALFIVGVVLATIVVAFVSFLIGSMIFESKNSVEDTSIKIAFYAEEDAEDIYTFDAKLGDQIVLPTAEECEFEAEEGYELKCWALEGEGTTYEPGERVVLTESVNFYAVWEEKQEGPEDPNPGNPDNPTPEDPTPGNPDDPTNPDNPPENLTVMFQVFIPKKGILQTLGQFYVEIGDSITLPTIESFNFSVEGYRFVGWRHQTDEDVLQPGETFVISSEFNDFWSVWEEIEEPEDPDNPTNPTLPTYYHVRYWYNGAVIYQDSYTDIGEYYTIPTNLSAAFSSVYMSQFKGWEYNGNIYSPGDRILKSEITEDIDFVAVFNGDSNPVDPEDPEEPEDPTTPEEPEDPTTPEDPEDPTTPEDPEITKYTVELYTPTTDNLDTILLKSYEVKDGEYFTFPSIESLGYEKEGFSFVGWQYKADGYVIYTPGEQVLINETIYSYDNCHFHAIWEEVEEPEPEDPEEPEEPEITKYTVELYADDSLDELLESYEVEEGEYFTLPTIESFGYEKEGYEFVSWNDGKYMPGARASISDVNKLFWAS